MITEAGFGSDLGAEKFLNIKAREAGFKPSAVVVVATIRALKMHGGVAKTDLVHENVEALKNGIKNLAQHVANVRNFGLQPVVALNRFITDTEAELKVVLNWAKENNVRIARTNVWEEGGKGGIELAKQVLAVIEQPNDFHQLYELHETVEQKITKIVQQVYGGKGIQFTDTAKKQLAMIEKNGWNNLPICMAKTQYSLSDQPNLLGRPQKGPFYQILKKHCLPES